MGKTEIIFKDGEILIAKLDKMAVDYAIQYNNRFDVENENGEIIGVSSDFIKTTRAIKNTLKIFTTEAVLQDAAPGWNPMVALVVKSIISDESLSEIERKFSKGNRLTEIAIYRKEGSIWTAEVSRLWSSGLTKYIKNTGPENIEDGKHIFNQTDKKVVEFYS